MIKHILLAIVIPLITSILPVCAQSLEQNKSNIRTAKPTVIAVRKVRNMAGSFAEDGVVEGAGGRKRRVGFWKPSYEIRLAEILANELANTGHFTVVERENLYAILEEQALQNINKKTSIKKNNLTQANYIIIATLSDYVPNSAGARTNSDGHFLIFGAGKDRTTIDTYVAFDLRVIDTSTGTIKLSRTVEGSSSSIAKADRFAVSLLGIASNKIEDTSYETTSATRALRAAMIRVVEYLDCHLYLKDSCVIEYKARDLKRKEATKGSLNLF